MRKQIFNDTAAVSLGDVLREAQRLSESAEPAVRVSLAGRKALKKAKAAVSGLSLD